jgi:hypothetical protein
MLMKNRTILKCQVVGISKIVKEIFNASDYQEKSRSIQS